MHASGFIFRLCCLLFLFNGSPSILVSQVNLSQLQSYIEEAREAWDVPGMSVGIVYDGKVVMAEGFGKLEVGKPATADGNSLFAIASNTKAFIGTALSILVEERKIKWEDKVRDHLPYFALYDTYVSENVSIEDLLCHRVGLGTYSGDVIWYKSDYSAEEVIKRIKHVPQAYGFRDGYGYSNLMFITAGEVIKAVSGQSWAAFVKDRILDPLGMQRTQTTVSTLGDMQNVASPHKPFAGENHPIPYANWDNMGAAGGIVSSAADMTKWLQMQLQGGMSGEDTFFTAATQSNMWHPHNALSVSAGYKRLFPSTNFRGYGLGWSLNDYLGRKVVSHGGGYDGMYSRVVMVPEAGLGIVVLTNSMKGISTYVANHIVDLYLGNETPNDWKSIGLERQQRGDSYRVERVAKRHNARIMDTQPALDLSAFVGTYHSDMYGDIEILLENAQLFMHIPHAPSLDAKLTHWHYDTFEIKWKETHAWFDFGTLNFELGNNGTVTGATFDVPNDDIFFEEIELVKVN